MLGKHAMDWFRPEDKEAALAYMENCMSKGTANLEAPLVMKDGREVPYLLTSSRLDTKEGSFFMGVGIDVTERRELDRHMTGAEPRAGGKRASLQQADGAVL